MSPLLNLLLLILLLLILLFSILPRWALLVPQFVAGVLVATSVLCRGHSSVQKDGGSQCMRRGVLWPVGSGVSGSEPTPFYVARRLLECSPSISR